MTSSIKVQPRRLKGFQDYNPELMSMRYQIMDAVRHEAFLAGFQAIGTPALEYAEVLLGVGGETDKQIFRFMDNGERDVALRFDLTVPFARYVAEHQGELTFPFKRLQIGDVWRAEKPQKGRYREFCQCDLDIVGVSSLEADVEILVCFHNILTRIGVGPFTMTVGQRTVLTELIRQCLGALDAEREAEALIAIDKLQKVGRDRVIALLAELRQGDEAGPRRLLEAIEPQGPNGTDLEAVAALVAASPLASTALGELAETVRLTNSLCQGGGGKTVVDLTIARGLGYYTGVVFETNLDELPGFGSVASGGRYDRLIERFVNRELAGIGGSLGLDRLLAGLVELGRAGAASLSRTVFVALATEDARAYGFALALSLRRAGISCDIAMKTAKLGNQFKHANRLGYPFVLTVGSEEAASSLVSVKEMASGQEDKAVPLSEITKLLRHKLKVT